MEKEKVLNGIVKIAFTYLFILFLFIIYKFMFMEFVGVIDYFANFVMMFIPLGIPAWIMFFIFSFLKKKSFEPVKVKKAVPIERMRGGTLLTDDELIK